MNKQWFFENGARLYILFLLLLVASVIAIASGFLTWSWVPLTIVLFLIAGNVKLTHGIMFSDGKMKYWNIFCSAMFNGLSFFYIVYAVVVL